MQHIYSFVLINATILLVTLHPHYSLREDFYTIITVILRSGSIIPKKVFMLRCGRISLFTCEEAKL